MCVAGVQVQILSQYSAVVKLQWYRLVAGILHRLPFTSTLALVQAATREGASEFRKALDEVGAPRVCAAPAGVGGRGVVMAVLSL
jgi:hypothetical protein